MSVSTQLSAPPSTVHKKGRFTLNRIVRCEATATAPVSWTNMTNVVAVEWGEPSWDEETDILQQGAGDLKTHIKHGPRWDGTITVLSGSFGEVVAKIQGITWGTTSATQYGAISMRMDNDYPQVIWEAVCRDDDNKTHLFSACVQDMIIDDLSFSNPMDYEDATIPFHTYHEPFLLTGGAELVYDQWTATGSGATLTTYTLSATPIRLASPSIDNDWYWSKLVYAKTKSSSASTGTRWVEDVTVATTTVALATPTAGDTVQILYAKITT